MSPLSPRLSTAARRRFAAAVVPLGLLVACSTTTEDVTAPPAPSPTTSAAPSPSAPVDGATELALVGLEERFDARSGVYAVDPLDAALEELGDDVTTVVRDETELNDTAPGDDRDTSTARALAGDLRAFAVDEALAERDRARLVDWMSGNATGDALVRAGVPAGWVVADKSGAAAYGTRNDIAVVYPPDGEPIVVAVLSDRAAPDADDDDALVAEAARIVVDALR